MKFKAAITEMYPRTPLEMGPRDRYVLVSQQSCLLLLSRVLWVKTSCVRDFTWIFQHSAN